MDPDIERIERAVKENKSLIEENNQMLKKIRRYMVANVAIKAVYWIVIFGAAFGAYYLIQPYLDALKGTYTNVSTGFDQVRQVGSSVTDVRSIQDMIKELVQ